MAGIGRRILAIIGFISLFGFHALSQLNELECITLKSKTVRIPGHPTKAIDTIQTDSFTFVFLAGSLGI